MSIEAAPQEVINYFHAQTLEKDPTAKVVNNLGHFEDGIAAYQSGSQPIFDEFAAALAPNFKESHVHEDGLIVPALDSARTREFCERFHEQRDKKPVIVIIPHPSIASPYIAARFLNMPFEDDIAEKTYSIVGPRPMLYEYKTPLGGVSPYGLGTMLNNLILTGTNTVSTDDAPDIVKDWLKEQGSQCKKNLQEIMEPKKQGDNNILIVCPSGKIGEQKKGYIKEFRPRSYRYAAELADRAVFWPIGIHDNILVDPNDPSSLIYVNPDGMAHTTEKNDEDDIFTLHVRATDLATSAIGKIKMQTYFDARGRHFMKRAKDFRKK